MLGINCLLNTMPLKNNLKAAMEYVAWDIAAQGKKPSLSAVYNRMVKDHGIEIDIQTLGNLYLDSFGRLNDPIFDDKGKVDKATGRTYEALKRVMHNVIRKKTIGADSPAVSVAAALAKALEPGVGSDASVQRLMQDALLKWAKRKLGVQARVKTPEEWQSVVERALNLAWGTNNLTAGGLTIGTLANSRALVAELQTEFQDLIAEIEASNPNSPYVSELVKAAAQDLAALPHSLLLSTAEARKVITGIIKRAHEFMPEAVGPLTKTVKRRQAVIDPVTRQQTRDPNTGELMFAETEIDILDWKAIIKATDGGKSPWVTLETITQATMKGIATTTGGQYSPGEIQIVIDSLQSDFDSLLKQHKVTALQALNKNAVTPAKRVRRSEFEQLAYLYDLDAFQSSTRDALYRVAGVPDMTADQLAKVESILATTASGYRRPITEWSPTFRMALQRAIENELEAIAETQDDMLRRARLISHTMQIGTNLILMNPFNLIENLWSGLRHTFYTTVTSPTSLPNVLMYMVDYYISTVVGGPKVGVEASDTFDRSGNAEARYNWSAMQMRKTMRGKTPNIWEWMRFVTSAISQAGLTATDAAFKGAMMHQMMQNAVVNVIQKKGGLKRSEAIMIVNEALYGDHDRIAAAADAQLNILKALGQPINSALKRRIMAEMAYSNLLTEGRVFDNMLNDIIAGTHTGKAARHWENRSLVRRTTEILGFRESPDLVAAAQKLKAADVHGLNKELLRAVQRGAVTAAARSMGHESDSRPLRWAIDGIMQRAQNLGQTARAEGNLGLGGVAGMELAKAGIYGLTRFRSGGMRWWWMSLMRIPVVGWPYMLFSHMTHLASNKPNADGRRAKAVGRFRYYDFDAIDIDAAGLEDSAILEKQFEFYMNKREQLVRIGVGSLVEAAIGYYLLLGLLKSLDRELEGSDEEEDRPMSIVLGTATEEERQAYENAKRLDRINSLAVWIQSDPNRKKWAAKLMPMTAQMLLQRRLNNAWDLSKGTRKDFGKTDLTKPVDWETELLWAMNLGEEEFGPFVLATKAALATYSGHPVHEFFSRIQEAAARGENKKIGDYGWELAGNLIATPLAAPLFVGSSYYQAVMGAQRRSSWEKDQAKALREENPFFFNAWHKPFLEADLLYHYEKPPIPESHQAIIELADKMPLYANDLMPEYITDVDFTMTTDAQGQKQLHAPGGPGEIVTLDAASNPELLPVIRGIYADKIEQILTAYPMLLSDIQATLDERFEGREGRAAQYDETGQLRRSGNIWDIIARLKEVYSSAKKEAVLQMLNDGQLQAIPKPRDKKQLQQDVDTETGILRQGR